MFSRVDWYRDIYAYADLFRRDLVTGEETRLTQGLRDDPSQLPALETLEIAPGPRTLVRFDRLLDRDPDACIGE